MRYFLLLFVVSFVAGCNPPGKEKDYAFEKVNWSIKVPPGYEIMDSVSIAEINTKGEQAIEKTYDTTADFSQTKTLIALKKGKLNTFTATITPFDPAKDGSWQEMNQQLKDIMFETSQMQMPDVKIDRSSSAEKIGGLVFDKFYTKITYPNGMVLHTYLYSQLRKGYDFGITITYTDEKIGDKLKDILLNSKFD